MKNVQVFGVFVVCVCVSERVCVLFRSFTALKNPERLVNGPNHFLQTAAIVFGLYAKRVID